MTFKEFRKKCPAYNKWTCPKGGGGYCVGGEYEDCKLYNDVGRNNPQCKEKVCPLWYLFNILEPFTSI